MKTYPAIAPARWAWQRAFCALVLLLGTATQAAAPLSSIRLEPHRYFGKRGNEPAQQLLLQGQMDWSDSQSQYPWRLTLHGDFETFGRKDNSIDIDRAWIGVPLGEATGPSLIFGRIHPFDVSRSFEATRPWGMLAQSQAQNRSILLGSPFTENPFPTPVLQGWIGAHIWSDTSHTQNFQWGFSATPVFIPSMGSSVAHGNPVSSRVGRFGRQPPGEVEIKGRRFPIQYQIDTSEILGEVLQPQLMGQTYLQGKTKSAHFESWLAVSRAPTINPETAVKGSLDLREDQIQVISRVKPTFPQVWMASLSNRVSSRAAKGYSLFSSLQYTQGGEVGAEVGVSAPYVGVSYLNQFSRKVSIFDSASYADNLVQVEGRLPISKVVAYGGAKYHILSQGSWIRAGVRTQVNDDMGLDVGMDMFTGRNGSYFSEWRTNDRVYLGLNWRLGK